MHYGSELMLECRSKQTPYDGLVAVCECERVTDLTTLYPADRTVDRIEP
jgi:hypothetical protein